MVRNEIKTIYTGGLPMAIRDEILEELLKEYKSPEDLIGKDGILKELTKRLVEKAMESELTHHLGYDKYSPAGKKSGNSRNGKTSKTIKGDFGELPIEVPRDRNGAFNPQIIPKHQTRFSGFDDKIISMYARGMTTRDIQDHLQEIYGVEVSADLISTVTDGVITDVKDWQNRPLDEVYPVLYLDATILKVRSEGRVINKSAYLAIGVNLEGLKDVLGIWLEQNEGAKFWLKVMTELKNRGVRDIFIACVDGLKGFPEAIEAAFPKTEVQLCIVHMIRGSLRFVAWKDRKAVVADLKGIYQASSEELAQENLEVFARKWDGRYPTISKSWQANWQRIIPFFAYPEEIRRIIYTTNAIESLNNSLKKTIKNRASFPNDEAAIKLLYLSLKNIQKKWTMPARYWGHAINQFAILYGDRMP
jgi:putative transposase